MIQFYLFFESNKLKGLFLTILNRWMGYLRSHVKNKHIRKLLFSEIVHRFFLSVLIFSFSFSLFLFLFFLFLFFLRRVIKNNLRKQMRNIHFLSQGNQKEDKQQEEMEEEERGELEERMEVENEREEKEETEKREREREKEEFEQCQKIVAFTFNRMIECVVLNRIRRILQKRRFLCDFHSSPHSSSSSFSSRNCSSCSSPDSPSCCSFCSSCSSSHSCFNCSSISFPSFSPEASYEMKRIFWLFPSSSSSSSSSSPLSPPPLSSPHHTLFWDSVIQKMVEKKFVCTFKDEIVSNSHRCAFYPSPSLSSSHLICQNIFLLPVLQRLQQSCGFLLCSRPLLDIPFITSRCRKVVGSYLKREREEKGREKGVRERRCIVCEGEGGGGGREGEGKMEGERGGKERWRGREREREKMKKSCFLKAMKM